MLINFCLISLILLISVYLDLKFRIVSKIFFLGYFILMLILNTFEYVLFFNNFQIFFLTKLFIVIILLSSSFLLFALKIFGGSDGKLVIIIFIIHPLSILNTSIIFLFYLMFSFLFILIFIINYALNNLLHDKHSFTLLFDTTSESSTLKKLFIKGFYKFYNYSDLSHYEEKKYHLKSISMVYNCKKNCFQLLCQYRAPLIPIIAISYYFSYYFVIVL